MGIEEPVMAGASASAGLILSPIGKWNLRIAGVFFVILIILGISESVEQHSVYPLFSNTLLKIVSADSQLGQQIDAVESVGRPVHPSSILSKAFPVWLMFWLKFWFVAVSSLYFIWFFGYFLYWIFSLQNTSLVLRNVLLAVGAYLIVAVLVGAILYNLSLAGRTVSNDKAELFSQQMNNIYPFHGTIKFFSHWVNKDLFYKINALGNSTIGSMITNIPDSSNVLNSSNVSGVSS